MILKIPINPYRYHYCFNKMPFKDSLETPFLFPRKTCTKELDEKKLMKGTESNCCLWSSPSDMAPLYAIEIAKLWLKQNCRNTDVPRGQKMSKVKKRNDQQIKDSSVMTSGEEVVQYQQIHDSGMMTGEKVMQCQQMRDTGLMTAGENVMQCQQIKDIGVVTSGQRFTWCQQIKDIAVMTSKESQQIKEIGVMTSGEKVMQCQQIKDIGVVTSGQRVTLCQQINDIGVMTSREKVTQSPQTKDIGVMTSEVNITQCQQIKDIGVMTSREKVTQSQQTRDIDVMTEGEKVTQCLQKSFSDEYESHRIMAVDGSGGYRTLPPLPQVPKSPNTDHTLKSRNMTHAFQKCLGSNKQYTSKEIVNNLAPEGRGGQTVKQTDIYSTTVSENSEIMEGIVMKNSCVSKCANFSVSEPTILKNTINKHRFHEYNSSGKKYSITTEKTLFKNRRSREKWCVNSHSVICNVMHRLPLEGSGKSSYSRLLLSEGGTPREKLDSKKLCELLLEINTQDTTQTSGNCDCSERKTVLPEHVDSRGETKDEPKVTCCSVHHTKENNDLQGIHKTNMKVNQSNCNPQTNLHPPVNINPEMHCNRVSEITERDHRMNILQSKGNSLEFPTMDHHFTYNVEAKTFDPWLQQPSQRIGSSGYDTKIETKSYETTNTIRKLKGEYIENEFQDEANICGQRGVQEIKQNNGLHFKKQKQKSDEGISTMNGIRLTFTDTQAEEENTKKITNLGRSILSFFQNLIRTLDSSRKREKQPVYNKSSTFLTVCFKKHKRRKSKKERHGRHQKEYVIRTSEEDRRTLAEKGLIGNYSTETNSSTEKTPTSSSQENIDNSYKKHSLTHPVFQDLGQPLTGNMEQPKSLHNHDKMKHSIIVNKQQKLEQRPNSYKKQISQAHNYTSSKANRQVHDFTRSKENEYCDQPQIHTDRQKTVNLVKDSNRGEDVLNRNVTIPVFFRDETPTPKTDEGNKNVVVMLAEVHSSNVMLNPDIMEELRQQRQDINSLKKLLANKENKMHNTRYFKNTRKSKLQHMNDITSDFGMPIVPDYNKHIINFQTASDTQNIFGVTEKQLSEHVLKQKCENLSLQDYFEFNSIRFKNRGQAQDVTANHHTDICYDCADEITWGNNTRHDHRKEEEKHVHYVIRHCRNHKTNFWNKILNYFR